MNSNSTKSILLKKDRYPQGVDVKLMLYDLNVDWDISTGTVIDKRTGLMWQRLDKAGKLTWKQAKEYCANLKLGGFSDWRIPSFYEMKSLHTSLSKSIGWSEFKKIPLFSWRGAYYWSSTPWERSKKYMDCFRFSSNYGVNHMNPSESYNVRAVRTSIK